MSEDGGNIGSSGSSDTSFNLYTVKLVIMDANIQARVHFVGQTKRLVLWVLHLSGASVENIVVVG